MVSKAHIEARDESGMDGVPRSKDLAEKYLQRAMKAIAPRKKKTPGVEFDNEPPYGAAAVGMPRDEYIKEYNRQLAEEAKIARMSDAEYNAYSKVAAACKRLFRFIAYFDKCPKQEWSGGPTKGEDGVLRGSFFCNHSKELQRFLDVFYKHDELSDKDYFGTLKRHGIEDEESRVKAIPSANVELLLAMLTFYIRGDRFSEGFLDCAIQEGVIVGILKRLREIYS